MKRLAVLALILLAGCSTRVRISVASGADMATTAIVLQQGGRELNPVFKDTSLGVMTAAKVGITVYVICVCGWLDRNGYHGWSNVVEVLAVGAWSAAAIFNARSIN